MTTTLTATNSQLLEQRQRTMASRILSDVPCTRCGVGSCDVRVIGSCQCHLHARCTPLVQEGRCPGCSAPCRSLYLIPMSFAEIDEARRVAAAASASGKREKKRTSATIARLNPEEEGEDLRTGRWTQDEMAYCDKLIDTFERGQLPVADGAKLNDFLASMLKSKQSRLTKKMKHAKLSLKSYQKTTGYIVDQTQAREFSELEAAFFRSISCSMERAEVRFHLQMEWRELFSRHCVQAGQKLEADDWLSSVEEMDRRASQAKDAARMARRKKMMGSAYQQDSNNASKGIFIDAGTASVSTSASVASNTSSVAKDDTVLRDTKRSKAANTGVVRKPSRAQQPPFLTKVLAYIERHRVPFEHIDAWVPSFVNEPGSQQTCRLCYAGCATATQQVPPDGRESIPISNEEKHDLHGFGEYSQKFSFNVGCGLPGRVYRDGTSSWEQSVHKAPKSHFERRGGALQWGIRTVLGIPIPSPNVGRIVILLYSRHDRNQDQPLVARLMDEMTKLLPAPRWKLVVDVGNNCPASKGSNGTVPVSRTGDPGFDALLKVLEQNMPTGNASAYLPGFLALKSLLLKASKSEQDKETLKCLVQSHKSYISTGRNASEVAILVINDYLAISQKATSQRDIASALPRQQQSPSPSSVPIYLTPSSNVHTSAQPFQQHQPQQQIVRHAKNQQQQISHVHQQPHLQHSLTQQHVNNPSQLMQQSHHQQAVNNQVRQIVQRVSNPTQAMQQTVHQHRVNQSTHQQQMQASLQQQQANHQPITVTVQQATQKPHHHNHVGAVSTASIAVPQREIINVDTFAQSLSVEPTPVSQLMTSNSPYMTSFNHQKPI